MDPKEFSWGESQQVTVTNPTKNDHKFMVHSKEYEMKAGEVAKMPGFIAWVYVYGLASQMAQADKNWLHWNEEGYRKQYYEKVVVGADDLIEKIEKQPAIDKVVPVVTGEPKVTDGRPAKV